MAQPFACVVNLGCRVNRVESDRITADLSAAGFALVDEDAADVVVINTCAVTGEAEAKTRKAVRHALNQSREPIVIVTGCVVNLHPGELTDLSSRVIAEPSKIDVARRALEALGMSGRDVSQSGDSHNLSDLLGCSRLGIKVQDGCNNRCSYCIVWKARGAERSVPVESVLEQVRLAERAGIPEVVLTGINLGAYDGVDAGDSHVEIDELVRIILEQTNISQVRLSSLEPMDVSERLVDAMVAGGDRVAPFVHLPLQSGCTSTLERMNRPYTADEYERGVAMIREKLPQVAVSCDIIAGFPGETDEEFAESLAFCERIGFSRMHVFRYSARPGTPAAEAPDQVAPEVMAERGSALRRVAERTSQADARARIGSHENAVLEYGNRGTLGSFHRVIVDDAPQDASGTLVRVAITGMDERGLLHARLVDADEQGSAALCGGAA
ncbi:MAG: MiaB/RimO family radical SAM methylthiotransferase [Coriobacteriaceae bacterium]|nr:MiaB/RimO family radical SAM methylthiotransferase [Coriobacteriaceae bacterium]